MAAAEVTAAGAAKADDTAVETAAEIIDESSVGRTVRWDADCGGWAFEGRDAAGYGGAAIAVSTAATGGCEETEGRPGSDAAARAAAAEADGNTGTPFGVKLEGGAAAARPGAVEWCCMPVDAAAGAEANNTRRSLNLETLLRDEGRWREATELPEGGGAF